MSMVAVAVVFWACFVVGLAWLLRARAHGEPARSFAPSPTTQEKEMKTALAHRPSLSPQVEHALRVRLLEARRRHLELAEPPEWKDEVDMEDRDMAVTLVARARAAVNDIDAALDRMAAGTYGCCERCAQPLPRQRLEAVPTATRCLACAERRVGSGLR